MPPAARLNSRNWDEYYETYQDSIAEGKRTTWGDFQNAFAKALEPTFRHPDNDRPPSVLVAGVASVRTAHEVYDFCDKNMATNFFLTFFDLHRTPLDLIKPSFDKLGRDNVGYVQGDVRELPFTEDTFKIVTSDRVLLYVEPAERDGALNEMQRTLVASGLGATTLTLARHFGRVIGHHDPKIETLKSFMNHSGDSARTVERLTRPATIDHATIRDILAPIYMVSFPGERTDHDTANQLP